MKTTPAYSKTALRRQIGKPVPIESDNSQTGGAEEAILFGGPPPSDAREPFAEATRAAGTTAEEIV